MWHILAIGRDPMLLETRRLLLEAVGCAVVTAPGLEGAIAACKSQHFDVIVLCHSLGSDEADHIANDLAECAPTSHILRLRQYEDAGYDPSAFIHRVQDVASSISGAA